MVKTKKSIFSFIVTAVMLASTWLTAGCFEKEPPYVPPPEYYEISSNDDFYRLLKLGFPASNENNENKAKYKLTCDIDLAGRESVDATHSYVSTDDRKSAIIFEFDGNGHTIKNATLHGDNNVGLFSRMLGGASPTSITVKNLVVDGISVSGDNNVGALFGIVGAGDFYRAADARITIDNVKVKNATISSSGEKNVGGLIGYLFRGIVKVLNTSVENSEICSATPGKTTNSIENVGGLIGMAESANNLYNEIKDCSSVNNIIVGKNCVGGLIGAGVRLNSTDVVKGDVYANLTNSSDVTGETNAGGIIGCLSHRNNETNIFTNCENKPSELDETTGITATSNNAGGIVGSTYWNGSGYLVPGGSSLKFDNCKNSAKVYAETNSGGIAGFIRDKYYLVTNLNSINNGEISGVTNVAGIVAKFGGNLVGSQQFVFENCENHASITGKDYVAGISAFNQNLTETILFKNCKNTSDTATIKGVNYVAGINAIYGTYQQCENNMDILYNDDYTGNATYFGGIVGYGTDSYLRECKNSGNVLSYTMLNTASYVGGLAGYSERVFVTDGENTGDVAGTSNVGGLIGYANVKILSADVNNLTNVIQNGKVYAIGQQNATLTNYQEDTVVGNVGVLIGLWNTGLRNFEISNVTADTHIYMLYDSNYVGGWCGRLEEFTATLITISKPDCNIKYTIHLGKNTTEVCEDNFKYGSFIFDAEDVGETNLNGFNSAFGLDLTREWNTNN